MGIQAPGTLGGRIGLPFALATGGGRPLSPSAMNGSQVLVVDPVPTRLTSTKTILERAGFDVHATDRFSAARRRLDVSPPDVLVTQLRLGANNGLHLVLRGRRRYPGMGAIITSRTADTVLQAEADRMGVTFLRWPVSEPDLVASVRARCEDSRLREAWRSVRRPTVTTVSEGHCD